MLPVCLTLKFKFNIHTPVLKFIIIIYFQAILFNENIFDENHVYQHKTG